MSRDETTYDMVTCLEDLLVREFRIFQSLLKLTTEERAALSRYDVETLSSLIERKETLLDELGRLEESRQTIVQELAETVGVSAPFPTIMELFPKLDTAIVDRLERLREGSMVIIRKVRDMKLGNQVLAAAALDRMDAIQAFLLSLFQSPPGYNPAHSVPAVQPAASLETDKFV